MRTNPKEELILPADFSGAAQLLLYTRYGDPRISGFEQKWITAWDVKNHFPWFPKRRIFVHKHFKTMLEEAFSVLSATQLYEEIHSFDGAYALRSLRGSRGVLSIHSWGAAIDLNMRENPLGSAGKWSREFIAVMQQHNICCGQEWSGRKDPMHFAMVDG